MSPSYLSLICCYICLTYSVNHISAEDNFKLKILHNNDFHSRFAPTTLDGSPCNESMTSCIGGISRNMHLVEKIRQESKIDILYLNAGDFFQGSLWFTMYKSKVVIDFVLKMGYDAISFGNHEFDDGVAGVAPFVDACAKANLPILAANLDVSKEPRLQSVRRSTIISKSGRKIAIIGYITPETVTLASPGHSIIFNDEIDSIRNEIQYIKDNFQDVNIFIALGHSGFLMDQKIATEIPDLDIIVGGHSNTFLYSGEFDQHSKPSGPYPVVINHGDKKSLVVTAFAYGKFLGNLDVEFDKNGNIVKYDGQPIFVDSNVSKSTKDNIDQLVQSYDKELQNKFSEIIGSTAVDLPGDYLSCRVGECAMGNLITDAYVDHFVGVSRSQNFIKGWTKYPIAVTSSGDIRNSKNIDLSIPGSENFTLADVLNIIPFGNEIESVILTGDQLFQVMEHSVSTFDLTHSTPCGKFLQISGLKVIFDVMKPVGHRVVKLSARCSECHTPEFLPVNRTQNYHVLTTNYIVKGGDGYDMVASKNVIKELFGFLDFDLLEKYIRHRSPITTGLDGRITVLYNSGNLVKINISVLIISLFAMLKLC